MTVFFLKVDYMAPGGALWHQVSSVVADFSLRRGGRQSPSGPISQPD